MEVVSATLFTAVGTRHIRLSQAPPQRSLWRHQHPTAAQTSPVTTKKSASKIPARPSVEGSVTDTQSYLHISSP